jgi:23S rRNA pseudouridine1911/1915/1917 synthase
MPRVPPDLSQERTDVEYVVRADEAGARLDLFLRDRIPWRSRQHLKARVREGDVRVNDGLAKVAYAVREGDVVRVLLRKSGIPFDPSTIPLPILYEDDVIVAIDKPAGFVVHPVGAHQMDTIVNALHHRYRRPDDPENDVVPKLAHRLDQYTSGVLLVAKRDDVRSELGRQFAAREVRKEYVAIVRGRPDPAEGEVEAPIGPTPGARNGLPMIVRDDGEPSLTAYALEQELGPLSVVRFRPMSGRTHQIRVHAQWLGTPLVADALYGGGDPVAVGGEVVLSRYPLHSAKLTFRHPVRDEPITIDAPLAEDMVRAIAILSERLPDPDR